MVINFLIVVPGLICFHGIVMLLADSVAGLPINAYLPQSLRIGEGEPTLPVCAVSCEASLHSVSYGLEPARRLPWSAPFPSVRPQARRCPVDVTVERHEGKKPIRTCAPNAV